VGVAVVDLRWHGYAGRGGRGERGPLAARVHETRLKTEAVVRGVGEGESAARPHESAHLRQPTVVRKIGEEESAAWFCVYTTAQILPSFKLG